MNKRDFLKFVTAGIALQISPLGYGALTNTPFDLKQTTQDISTILLNYIFEGNDSMTRRAISVEVNEYLRGKAGLRNFDVVSNERNNTPDTIDSGLIVEVYLMPDKEENIVIHKYEFRVSTVGVVMITDVD